MKIKTSLSFIFEEGKFTQDMLNDLLNNSDIYYNIDGKDCKIVFEPFSGYTDRGFILHFEDKND